MATWLMIIGLILIVIAIGLFVFIKTKWKQKINQKKNDEFGVGKDQSFVYTKIVLNTIVVLFLIAGIVLAFAKFYL